MRGPSDRLIRRLIWLLLVLALIFLGTAFYYPARAMLAGNLVEHAWGRTLAEHGRINRPWPWARSWPVARMQIAEQRIDEFVLATESGQDPDDVLPYSLSSEVDRNTGTIILYANSLAESRQFNNIRLGEFIRLQDETGTVISYQVQDLQIIDTRYAPISMPGQGRWLLLIYSFDPVPGTGTSYKHHIISAQSVVSEHTPNQTI